MKLKIGDIVEIGFKKVKCKVTFIDGKQKFVTSEELDSFGNIKKEHRVVHHTSFRAIKEGWLKVINGIH